MQFVIIFALVVAILAVMFALQNTAVVTLHFFAASFEEPLALFMLIAIALGAVLISILTIPGWFKSKKISSRHSKEVGELEDSLAKYRTDLIDSQNSNKDLRQKIMEVEEAKENLEHAQAKASQEIDDLKEALSKADLTAQEADQAKKEALDARDQMDSALKDLEGKMADAQKAADTAKAQTYSTNAEETVYEAPQEAAGAEPVKSAVASESDATAAAVTDETEPSENPETQDTADAEKEEKNKKHSWF